MKTRRILALIIAVLMMAALTAGCQSAATPAPAESAAGASTAPTSAGGEKVTLKFFHKWSGIETMPYFEAYVKQFSDKNPNVNVVMEAVGDEEAKSKLRVMMGAASQPDVYFSWCGEFAFKFIRADNAWDMTAALDADPDWKNSFMPAAVEPYTLDGKVYGIPFRIIGKYFIYNKDMFAKAGVSVPTTWDEFLTVCEKLKGAGMTPIAFGNQTPWPACHYITGLNVMCVPDETRVADYNYATGKFTDAGYVTALNLLNDLNTKGYFNSGINSISHDMAVEEFCAGKEAMMYVEQSELVSYTDKIKANLGQETGVFAMPQYDGNGGEGYLVGGPDGFMISSKCANPEVGMAFLKGLTSLEWQQKMITELNYPSPVIGAHTADNSAPIMLDAVKIMENSKAMANWLDTDVHTKVSDVYLPGMQELFNGTLTAEQLMVKIQEVAKVVAAEEAN